MPAQPSSLKPQRRARTLRLTTRASARGRPRDQRIDSEVITAVLQTLRRGGYRGVTIDGIARRVGRARSSLYRRWPSKRHLVAYAVTAKLDEHTLSSTGSVRQDLQAAVGAQLRAFVGPLGAALAGLIADMGRDALLAATIRRQLLARRRNVLREVLHRAQARGQVRHDLNVELVLDMLTAPLYFRALFGRTPLSREAAQQMVEYVLRAVRPRRA